jgi:hypothetical protein
MSPERQLLRGNPNRHSMRSQKQDKTTSPELERFLADRMKAKTIEVDASHVSLISKPKEIADLIQLAAVKGP